MYHDLAQKRKNRRYIPTDSNINIYNKDYKDIGDKIMSRKYVYVIECSTRFEDGSCEDFSYIWRIYSSLRKAQDCLELWKEIYTADLLNAGYDIECDVDHWVDYSEDGCYSSLTFKNGCEIRRYSLSRKILF